MAETGWTKEWPAAKDSFHWMRWVDGRYRDLPVHVNGIQVMCLFDHSYQQRGNIEGQVEFLGPISPSDFEQLTRLREAAKAALPYIREVRGYTPSKQRRANADKVIRRIKDAIGKETK